MAKTIVTTEYVSQFKAFLDLLAKVQDVKADPSGTVWFESGRKFDKVMIGNNVRYFVDRSKGIIYGAKSRLAPNMKWYFGTLSSASKWDWSGFHGTPVTDDSVKLVGEYGGYKHYEPLNS